LSKNLIVKTGFLIQNRTGKLVFARPPPMVKKARPAGDAQIIDPNQSLGIENAASFIR